jgi:hypothetical protein
MDITNDVRPDQVSYSEYEDPYYSWSLYLVNGITDPYYEWYMSDRQFTNFIKDKYGSIENATQKVAFYRNNWPGKEDIDVAAYDALDAEQKAYWEPVYVGSRIASYSRIKVDTKISTNYIIKYEITGAANNTPFTKNEVVSVKLEPSSNGKAQAIFSNSSVLMIQHIFDDCFPNGPITLNSNSYVYGTESGSNCTITSVNFVANNLSEPTASYWSPVYYVDYEIEKNEGNRTIRILRPEYVTQLVTDLDTELNK